MLDRYWQVFRKYGGVKSLYYILKWKLFNIQLNNIGRSILKMHLGSFEVIKCSIFESFYENDKVELEKIIKGERRILFYKEDDPNRSLDIKTKWEINRSQHGPILALNNSLESEEILEYVFSSLNLNSTLQDSNAMEVGIAAINLLTTFQLLNKNLKAKYSEDFTQYLKNSLAYIFINNEKGIIFSHNHYFFNLIASIWILESIESNKTLDKINRKCYNELIELLEQTINSDGSLYEGSSHYHKYVTDSLLVFLLFNENAQQKERLIRKAKTMYKFCCYASFNNDLIGVGDNDSGRILALPKYFDYNSSDLSFTNLLAESLNFESFNEGDEIKLSKKNLLSLKSFGLFKLKNPKWDIAIRLNHNNNEFLNRFIGSHYHNDQLSVLAIYRGEKILVDSGVYSYVQNDNIRYSNIKTSSHNTLVVNDLEQGVIFNDWTIPERPIEGKVMVFNEKVFQGRYTGVNNAVHRRKVEIGEKLIIIDEIDSEKAILIESVKVFFHFAPSIKPVVTDNGSVRLETNKNVLLMEFNKDCKVFIEKSIISSEYGEVIENFKVILVFEKTFFNFCKTTITPIKNNVETS